jgi:uncharacterized protein YaiE (UPF0345 family)
LILFLFHHFHLNDIIRDPVGIVTHQQDVTFESMEEEIMEAFVGAVEDPRGAKVSSMR